MYLCVYDCISDIFLLYYWIYAISLCISLLYLHSHFVPKIIWIMDSFLFMVKWLQMGKVVKSGLSLIDGSWVKQLKYNSQRKLLGEKGSLIST
jgi:hypothetical protein